MIKYKFDTRYDGTKIVTHDNLKTNGTVCEFLYQADDIVKDYDVVCIDEIQFYKDAHIFCDKWANSGIIVEACGLNGSFDRKQFPIISKLLPLVDNLTFLKAVCRETGNSATFTKRLTDSKEQEVIGGLDIYKAVDRKTYFDSDDNDIGNYINFVNIYATINNFELNSNTIEKCREMYNSKLNFMNNIKKIDF